MRQRAITLASQLTAEIDGIMITAVKEGNDIYTSIVVTKQQLEKIVELFETLDFVTVH
jgi:hypothetical protein